MRAVVLSLLLATVSSMPGGSEEEDRRAAATRLWTDGITDISGLSALTPFSRIPYDDQDLRSICAMKGQVLDDAVQASGDYLAHLKSLPETQQDRIEIMKL